MASSSGTISGWSVPSKISNAKLEETSDVTRICRYLPLLVLSLFSIQSASAQHSFDINLGAGGVQDKAGTTGFDGLAIAACTSSTSNCIKTKALRTFTMGVGGNLMLWKHFGVGASADFEPGKQTYGEVPAINFIDHGLPVTQSAYNVKSQVAFYQVDGTYVPVSSKKYVLQLIGGAGAATVKFSQQQTTSGTALGTFSSSSYFASVNHVQVHGGVGVQIYVSGNFFIRPEFDVHYVENFKNQFGSNLATAATIWVGYSFGSH